MLADQQPPQDEEGQPAAVDDPDRVGDWSNDLDYLSLPKERKDESRATADTNTTSSFHDYDEDDDGENDLEYRDADGNPIPPWMGVLVDPSQSTASRHSHNHRQRQKFVPPLTALHNEMVGLVRLLEPTSDEIKCRDNLVERIRQLVQIEFGTPAHVEVFGSQATGLFLPASDIDVVVLTGDSDDQNDANDSEDDASANANANSNHKPNDSAWETRGSPLERFAAALREGWPSNQLSYLEVVPHTRVPLVKFTDAATNISVDVSFDTPTGPPAARLMGTYLDALPALKPLTLILKVFLAARNLHQAYSGGVGSYALQLLIVAFLQQRERDAVARRRPPSQPNLGALLLEFLEFYGLEFNYWTTAISVRHDGFFFPKGARKDTFFEPDRPFLLGLENPLDPTADVGRPSFRIQTVQRAFKVAHGSLLARVTSASELTPDAQLHTSSSILAAILPPTPDMARRRRQQDRRRAAAPRPTPTIAPPPTSSSATRVDRPLAAPRRGGGSTETGLHSSSSSSSPPGHKNGGGPRKRKRRS